MNCFLRFPLILTSYGHLIRSIGVFMHVALSSNMIFILTQAFIPYKLFHWFWYVEDVPIFIRNNLWKTCYTLYRISLCYLRFINSWCQNLSAFVGTQRAHTTTPKYIYIDILFLSTLINMIHMHIRVRKHVHNKIIQWGILA